MGRISYENYGTRAASGLDPTRAAGRYYGQRVAERHILSDVTEKLALAPTDSLLEIGCGSGTLLLALSFRVEESFGIDHPRMVEYVNQRKGGLAVSTIAGNFLDIELARGFDKVLVYSVLHTLGNEDEVFRFVDKAAGLLVPGGRMLLGDLPNVDRKRRYLATRTGREADAAWRASSAAQETGEGAMPRLAPDPDVVGFDDRLVLELVARFRGSGLEGFVVPQPASLPFGNTREDILAIRYPQ